MSYQRVESLSDPETDLPALRLEQVRELAKIVLRLTEHSDKENGYAQGVIDSLPPEGQPDLTVQERSQIDLKNRSGQHIPSGVGELD